MDWDYYYYLGTVILNMTEETFWECTLNKLIKLLGVHKEINGIESEEDSKKKKGFIEDIF